jgi:hypothetical protein
MKLRARTPTYGCQTPSHPAPSSRAAAPQAFLLHEEFLGYLQTQAAKAITTCTWDAPAPQQNRADVDILPECCPRVLTRTPRIAQAPPLVKSYVVLDMQKRTDRPEDFFSRLRRVCLRASAAYSSVAALALHWTTPQYEWLPCQQHTIKRKDSGNLYVVKTATNGHQTPSITSQTALYCSYTNKEAKTVITKG